MFDHTAVFQQVRKYYRGTIVVGSSDKIYIDLNYSRKKDVFVVSQSSHFSLLHEFAN